MLIIHALKIARIQKSPKKVPVNNKENANFFIKCSQFKNEK
ncbi:hypothetical protein HPCPY6311_0072 [Helicobacter pylori CPY6311]|nr:hypothetical protein HPCPY6311_0072 [Helicobacter pylori CPY6311]